MTAFLFIYFYVPETKGRSLEEIAQIMGTAPEAHLAAHTEATANATSSPQGSSLPGYQDSEQAPLVHRSKAAITDTNLAVGVQLVQCHAQDCCLNRIACR